MTEIAAVNTDSATVNQESEAQAAAAAESAAAETGNEHQEETASEATAAQETAKPEEKGKELGEKGKAEVIRLRKRAQEAEKEAAYHRGRAEALESAGKTEHKSPAADEFPVPKPTQNEGEEYADYLLRLQDWNLDRRDWRGKQEVQKRTIATERETFNSQVAASQQRGEEKYGEDFVSAISSIPANAFAPAVIRSIFESDAAEDVWFYLGQNPAEITRIKMLTESKQIKEIARLEDKLKAGAAQQQTKTDTPPPPPTLRAGALVDDDKRYLDPNTSTADRIRISRERKRAAAAGR